MAICQRSRLSEVQGWRATTAAGETQAAGQRQAGGQRRSAGQRRAAGLHVAEARPTLAAQVGNASLVQPHFHMLARRLIGVVGAGVGGCQRCAPLQPATCMHAAPAAGGRKRAAASLARAGAAPADSLAAEVESHAHADVAVGVKQVVKAAMAHKQHQVHGTLLDAPKLGAARDRVARRGPRMWPERQGSQWAKGTQLPRRRTPGEAQCAGWGLPHRRTCLLNSLMEATAAAGMCSVDAS